MRFGINTLDEFALEGKTVLCRLDINQPVNREDGTLKSINRIQACVPTVQELSDRGAKVVLLAHQGSDIEYNNYFTTAPHAAVLSRLLGSPVRFVPDVTGPTAQSEIRSLKNGDILLLDNVRFCAEEQTLFELKLALNHEQQAFAQVVQKLAPLADLYVCDAFAASHRNQPSLCGFEQVLPSAMGRLFEQEFCVVSNLMKAPAQPCVFVLGGSKIADAFLMMETVLTSGAADTVLTGGLVAQVLLLARGENIGSESLALLQRSNFDSLIDSSAPLLARYRDRLLLPIDFAYLDQTGNRREALVGTLSEDACMMDIGAQTAKWYAEQILSASTVFVNGPMGVFERPETELGTRVVWQALADTNGYTVLGGGDSITAAEQFDVSEQVDYICTGGGALIRFMTGEELPVVRALRHAASVFPADYPAT